VLTAHHCLLYAFSVSDVLPIPLGYNTAYLWTSGGSRVLIDTGPDYEGAWEEIQEALGGMKPDIVVATHAHLDHAGLGARWQEAGVPVAVGAADARLIREPQFTRPGELEAFIDYITSCGAPEEITSGAVARLTASRERAASLSLPGYRPDVAGVRYRTALRMDRYEPEVSLTEDSELPGGLQIISCPGHTLGNLVLFDQSERWLFSGDQLLEDITPTPGIQWLPPDAPDRFRRDDEHPWRFASLPTFVHSLERVTKLGATRCFPGHGVPFESVAELIATILGQISGRTDRVAGLRGEVTSLYELCDRLYRRATRRRFWQILSTIQGHLDLLDE
jgi:glyoxylase-like metal-dependent hydrolase (beta-lactamase superfamily II)